MCVWEKKREEVTRSASRLTRGNTVVFFAGKKGGDQGQSERARATAPTSGFLGAMETRTDARSRSRLDTGAHGSRHASRETRRRRRIRAGVDYYCIEEGSSRGHIPVAKSNLAVPVRRVTGGAEQSRAAERPRGALER